MQSDTSLLGTQPQLCLGVGNLIKTLSTEVSLVMQYISHFDTEISYIGHDTQSLKKHLEILQSSAMACCMRQMLVDHPMSEMYSACFELKMACSAAADVV